MNKFLISFLKNGIIGGVIIGIIMALIETSYVKLAGFIYGAIPYSFVIITLMLWFGGKKNKIFDFAENSYLGSFFFMVSMTTFFMVYKLYNNYWLALFLCILVIYVMYHAVNISSQIFNGKNMILN